MALSMPFSAPTSAPPAGFANVPFTPDGHFRLCFYGAVLHLWHRLLYRFDGQEGAAEHFPFLIGYINELALQGLDGMSARDSIEWWQTSQRAWERAAPTFLPLRALAQAGDLDDAAITVYMLIGLPEEDGRFGAVFEVLGDTPGQHRPTPGMLKWWFDGDGDSESAHVLVQQLLSANLIEVSSPALLRADWSLAPTPLLWDIVTGRGCGALPDDVRYRPADTLPTLDTLLLDHEVRDLSDRLTNLLSAGDVDTLIARGPQANGRKSLVGALARAVGRGILEVGEPFKPDDARWKQFGPLATALNAIPVVTYELTPGETAPLPRLTGYDGPIGVVLGRHGGVSGQGNVVTVTLEMPAETKRRQLWQQSMKGSEVADLDAISARFRLSSGNIRKSADLARTYARLSGQTAITLTHVRQATRALGRQVLDTLATPLVVSGDWGHLAANDDVMSELRMLETRCRHRELLREMAGGTLGSQLTSGVRALFTGPSGTGKTHAARLLASVLEMDLYRLDLSSVVNKYIGETEKNLNELLSRAEELDVMLLIDEGDSLLAQRTNVQTSNDRYANLETNFLLQRLESYTGIVIITTNAVDRVDGAFQRRMDVVVEFRAPDAAERWTLWQLHLPDDHRVDAALLRDVAARCTLTGGQIRNIVLHAMVLALDETSAVNDRHVEMAVQREYRRMGAICPVRAFSNSAGIHSAQLDSARGG